MSRFVIPTGPYHNQQLTPSPMDPVYSQRANRTPE